MRETLSNESTARPASVILELTHAEISSDCSERLELLQACIRDGGRLVRFSVLRFLKVATWPRHPDPLICVVLTGQRVRKFGQIIDVLHAGVR